MWSSTVHTTKGANLRADVREQGGVRKLKNQLFCRRHKWMALYRIIFLEFKQDLGNMLHVLYTGSFVKCKTSSLNLKNIRNFRTPGAAFQFVLLTIVLNFDHGGIWSFIPMWNLNLCKHVWSSLYRSELLLFNCRLTWKLSLKFHTETLEFEFIFGFSHGDIIEFEFIFGLSKHLKYLQTFCLVEPK